MSTDLTDAPIDPAIRQLHQLALDLRWSWNHASDELWRQLDPELWTRTHNPWVILRTVSRLTPDVCHLNEGTLRWSYSSGRGRTWRSTAVL
jgi:glucan phosphorylase